VCAGSALTSITITTTGATGIGTPIGLPAGVTASWLNNVITISGTPSVSGNFAYQIPLLGGCGIVDATGNMTVSTITLPTFNPIAQLCHGAAPIPALPSSSLNGITGIWSPPVISNTASGNYVFTPNPNQCASSTNLNVTVAPQVVLDGIYHD
jgi:hypothetical protein